MSIATRTGDEGTSALLYGHRVSKCHPRLEACGAVDELNAALGLVRAGAPPAFIAEPVLKVQKELVALMGELATRNEDQPQHVKDGFERLTPEATARLDGLVAELEAREISFRGWATPGATPLAASLDFARTLCRRSERAVCALAEAGDLPNAEILKYLNRLSDVLWLFARWAETGAGGAR